jgi:adenylate cyclase
LHRYVGDALIATWPLCTPQENGRPMLCLFACREALEAAGSVFLDCHGQIPTFRAGVHSGPTVAGEIGGFKREITVGDTMNTAAQLEQAVHLVGELGTNSIKVFTSISSVVRKAPLAQTVAARDCPVLY